MNLVIDIGNSYTKAAIFSHNTLIEKFRIQTIETDKLIHIAKENKVQHAIISNTGIDNSLEKKLKVLPLQVLQLSHNLQFPFTISYKTPETLGPDRLAVVAGAHTLANGSPFLVIDAGTAITYEILINNNYAGGNISPGLSMRFQALHHFTKRLPLLYPEQLNIEIGNNTTHAIIAGVQTGLIAEIEHYINSFSLKNNELKVFLTGGDAHFFEKQLKNRIFVEENLVLIGLNKILELNKQ